MRWGEKETCYFVKTYLRHNILWDPRRPEYKSKSERHKAYTNIIEDFRAATGIILNEVEVKTKVKNLRSTYIQEIAKIRKRSGPGSVYRPSIKWFSAWHKCFSQNKIKSLLVEDVVLENEETVDDTCQKIWVDKVNEKSIHGNDSADPFIEDNFLLVLKPEPDEVKPESKDSYKTKKKKIKHSTSTDNSDTSCRGSIDTQMTCKEDEFDIYGKFIASQLRKMDLQKALRLQLEIQSLVSEARISDLSES